MSRASTPWATSAFGNAPATSASPPVLAKGTASDERIAMRIKETDVGGRMKDEKAEAKQEEQKTDGHECFIRLLPCFSFASTRETLRWTWLSRAVQAQLPFARPGKADSKRDASPRCGSGLLC